MQSAVGSVVEHLVEIVAERDVEGELALAPDHAPHVGIGFEAGPVRFEACTEFRPSAEDPLVCGCGWLEDDHGELAAHRVERRRRRPLVTLPARRAS
jgi:hypothetical protein